jgi:hypothetical protein
MNAYCPEKNSFRGVWTTLIRGRLESRRGLGHRDALAPIPEEAECEQSAEAGGEEFGR